jgi:Flp pilus assembly protein TadD
MAAKQEKKDKLRELTEVITQFAVDLMYRGKYEKALKEVEEALSYDPGYNRALNVKALALSSLERFDESIAAAEKSIDLDPNEGISHSILGVCYGRAGNLDKADAALQKGIEVSPDDWITYYNAVCHYTTIEDFDTAVKYLKQAYEQAPKNVLALIEDDIDLDKLRGTPQLEAFKNSVDDA